jgi:molybdenum cofactor cytidylyltransferase
MPSVAVVPAAGRGERFGGAKLAAMLRGEPLLVHTLRSLIEGGVETIVLVTAPDADIVHLPLVSDSRVHCVTNPNPSRGMFSSIQAGVAAADGDPLLILPADMPFVRAETVRRLLAAASGDFRGAIVSPAWEGRRGHPIALPGSLRSDILAAGEGATLAGVLETCRLQRHTIEVDDAGVLRDVDVVSDLTPKLPKR